LKLNGLSLTLYQFSKKYFLLLQQRENWSEHALSIQETPGDGDGGGGGGL